MSTINIHKLAQDDKNLEALREEITKSPNRINERNYVSYCLDFVSIQLVSITTFFFCLFLKNK